jgi:hypothetical protein
MNADKLGREDEVIADCQLPILSYLAAEAPL